MNSEQQPNDNTQLPSWFSGDTGSTSTVVASHQTAPPTPPKKRRHLILLVSVILGIGLLVTAAYFVFMKPSTNCLTASDYKQLNEDTDPIEPFDPKLNFYSTYFEFQSSSPTYLADRQSQSMTEIQRIAAFYKAHTKKPMSIALHTTYPNDSGDATAIANERLAKVKTDLVSAGIPMIIISTNATGYDVNPDNELPDLPDGVTLSLTSSLFCDQ